jgi:hypothetical protein
MNNFPISLALIIFKKYTEFTPLKPTGYEWMNGFPISLALIIFKKYTEFTLLKPTCYEWMNEWKNGFPISPALIIFKKYTEFTPLKPTGYVMHQQFNIKQLYALPTLYLSVLYLSENKHRLLPFTA